MKRSDMDTDTVYFDRSEGLYGVTPDGVGVYWYDTLVEAHESMFWLDVPHVVSVNKIED